jgi:hypothetical protein
VKSHARYNESRSRPALASLRVGRDHPVAVETEAAAGLKRLPRGVAHVAERDDVARALVEVDRRMDHEVDVRRARRVSVDLRPDQLALECPRVEHDDGLTGVIRSREVAEGDGTGPS